MSDLIDLNGGPDERDPDFEPDLDDPSADPPASDDDWADHDDWGDEGDNTKPNDPPETGTVMCPDGCPRLHLGR